MRQAATEIIEGEEVKMTADVNAFYRQTYASRCTGSDMAYRFPAFIQSEADQREMEYWCPEELARWRLAVIEHYRIRSIDDRMLNFVNKAAAFETLKAAYYGAILQACEESWKPLPIEVCDGMCCLCGCSLEHEPHEDGCPESPVLWDVA